MAASVQLQDEIIRVEQIRAEQVAFYSKHPCTEATSDLNIVDNHLLTLRDLLNRSFDFR